MATLLTTGGGNRSTLIYGRGSSRPQVGSVVSSQGRDSLVFGSTLVISAVVVVPGVPQEFTGPPDFCLPEALRGEDLFGGTWPDSSTMAQRVIKCLLDGGILYYTQQPDALRRAMPFLEEKELSSFQTMLLKKPPRVVHQYPRALADTPVLAIRSGAERVSIQERYLVDYAAVGVDEYGDVGKGSPIEVFQVAFDNDLSVGVYSQNADVTIFWYEAAKFVLLQARLLLAKLGVDNLVLGGRDIHPLSRYQPEDIYVRELTIQCRTRQVFAQDVAFSTVLDLQLAG